MRLFRALNLVCLFVLLSAPSVGLTDQPPFEGGDFTVTRATVDSGGGASSGGEFIVRGTFGQHDPGRGSGGAYELRAGFWTTPGELEDALFKDRFEVIVPRLGQFSL